MQRNPPQFTSITQFSSVQSLSRVQLFEAPWTAACQASLSITNSWSLLKLMSIESVMPSIILCLSPPAFSLSQHQDLSQWVGFSHQVAKELQLQCQSFQWIFKVGFNPKYNKKQRTMLKSALDFFFPTVFTANEMLGVYMKRDRIPTIRSPPSELQCRWESRWSPLLLWFKVTTAHATWLQSLTHIFG